jgi:hypothetical protein
MELPPVEKRTQHNFVYVNLEKSFTNFELKDLNNES